jgi:ketopantoate reductase
MKTIKSNLGETVKIENNKDILILFQNNGLGNYEDQVWIYPDQLDQVIKALTLMKTENENI